MSKKRKNDISKQSQKQELFVASPHLVFYWTPSVDMAGEQNKLAKHSHAVFLRIPKRRVAKAVRRNRYKRLMREALRTFGLSRWQGTLILRKSHEDGAGPLFRQELIHLFERVQACEKRSRS